MTNLVLSQSLSQDPSVSSLDLLEMVNQAREQNGEPVLRRNVFHARVADELEGEHYKKIVVANANGTMTTVFELNHDQCLLVSMRESKAVRRSVLEKLKSMVKPSLPDFTNPVEAARAWADAKESEQKALAAAEAAKPAVEFVERYVSADSGNKGFRQVAKLLKVNEREFRQFLKDRKVMYQLGGEWMPYQHHIDAERFVVKAGVADNEHAYNTAKFTPKGINWIAGLWAQHQVETAMQEDAL